EEAARFVEAARPEPEEALRLLEAAAGSAQARGDHPGQAHWLAEAVRWSSGAAQAERAFRAALALRSTDPSRAVRLAEVAASAVPPDPEA
ncbi:hypothetical protein OFM36_33450, partial [Escherichia coli]|nr:hypothetical protein [Escherichia coli]